VRASCPLPQSRLSGCLDPILQSKQCLNCRGIAHRDDENSHRAGMAGRSGDLPIERKEREGGDERKKDEGILVHKFYETH